MGAASIFVKESLINENIKEFIIYGSKSSINKNLKTVFSITQFKKNTLKIIIILNILLKKNFSYINFETIEIHNRPEYIKEIKKNFPTSRILFFFHNDPDTLRGSKILQRKNI